MTRLTHITGQRVGLTIVTTSFATGEVGPLFVNITPGSVPQAELEQLREEFKDHTVIAESSAPTHFMNSESTWIFFELTLSNAFARQRNKYRAWGKTGLLMADAFFGEQWPRVPAPSREVGVDPLSAVAAEAARRLERSWPAAGVVSSIMSGCCIAPGVVSFLRTTLLLPSALPGPVARILQRHV